MPDTRDQLADVAPADVLVLMACGGKKLDRPAPLVELYRGPMWQTLRQHRDAVPLDNVAVLSGGVGFLNVQAVVAPYEARLTRQLADHALALGALHAPVGTGASPLVEAGSGRRRAPYRAVIVAGAGEYARVLAAYVEAFKQFGLVCPAAPVLQVRGGIGQQRQQLGQWLQHVNRNEAAPCDA